MKYMVLNKQYLSNDDQLVVKKLAVASDFSRTEIAGYGADYYFDCVPKGWAGETTRIVKSGPNQGLRIWDARKI